MKHIKRNITLGIILLSAFVYISCQKGDSQKPWGISKIYIPQAAAKDGGNTINYPVPMNNGINNYIYDTVKNTIDITLGVYRSGLEDLNSYSVTVAANVDTTNQIIAGGTIANAVLLPSDVYTLPTTASVLKGERESTFHLVIDRAKLIANYSNYYAKKLLLTVGISNPSRYVLNKSLSKIVIVIDAATFIPVPPKINLLKGGDMSAASAVNWIRIKQTTGSGSVLANILYNGVLTWTNGNGSVKSNDAIYQAFQVEQGKKYRFSADITYTGAVNSWFEVHIGIDFPIDGNDYHNVFLGFSVWTSNCLSSSNSGNMALLACEGSGVGKQGIFTAPITGTMYFLIKGGTDNGNMGTVTLDNVMITAEP